MRQIQWTVPDNELREAVRLQAQEIILPAYRAFLKRYRYRTCQTVEFTPYYYFLYCCSLACQVFASLNHSNERHPNCFFYSILNLPPPPSPPPPFWYCSGLIEGKQSVSKYLKYSPDDLERMLNELFEGKPRQDSRAQQGRPGGR